MYNIKYKMKEIILYSIKSLLNEVLILLKFVSVLFLQKNDCGPLLEVILIFLRFSLTSYGTWLICFYGKQMIAQWVLQDYLQVAIQIINTPIHSFSPVLFVIN